jgi:flavin reductase (DIM6/NTAB) family NADH-FMN oxidoreductase RutF
MRLPHTHTPASVAAIEDIFGLYDPPLWLLTAELDGRRGGLIATSVARVSIVAELPRVSIAIAKQHYTWELIQGSGRFALHLLGAADLGAVQRFGLPTGREQDKLSGLAVEKTPDGNPLYPGAASWMDCRVEQGVDIGDRTLYLAAVGQGAVMARQPLLTLGVLMRTAPPELGVEMDRLYRRDQEIDAAAIRVWRQGADTS